MAMIVGPYIHTSYRPSKALKASSAIILASLFLSLTSVHINHIDFSNTDYQIKSIDTRTD